MKECRLTGQREYVSVCVYVLLISEDITDNETAGAGSDILGNREVDI